MILGEQTPELFTKMVSPSDKKRECYSQLETFLSPQGAFLRAIFNYFSQNPYSHHGGTGLP